MASWCASMPRWTAEPCAAFSVRWTIDDRAVAWRPGYLACGVTDMRKGAVGLAMLVQQSLAENPFDGAVYAFRGRRSGLIKLIWHDGMRLEQGQFQWPSTSTTGRIALTSAQLAALLDGCEWRAPVVRQRPELAG
jgi:transposase